MVAIMLMLTWTALLLICAWQPRVFLHVSVVIQPHIFHMVKIGESSRKLKQQKLIMTCWICPIGSAHDTIFWAPEDLQVLLRTTSVHLFPRLYVPKNKKIKMNQHLPLNQLAMQLCASPSPLITRSFVRKCQGFNKPLNSLSQHGPRHWHFAGS